MQNCNFFLQNACPLHLPYPNQFLSAAEFYGPRFGFERTRSRYRELECLEQRVRRRFPPHLYRDYIGGALESVGRASWEQPPCEYVLVGDRQRLLLEMQCVLAAVEERHDGIAVYDCMVPSVFAPPRLHDYDSDIMLEQVALLHKMLDTIRGTRNAYSIADMQSVFKPKHMARLSDVLRARIDIHERFLKKLKSEMVAVLVSAVP